MNKDKQRNSILGKRIFAGYKTDEFRNTFLHALLCIFCNLHKKNGKQKNAK